MCGLSFPTSLPRQKISTQRERLHRFGKIIAKKIQKFLKCIQHVFAKIKNTISQKFLHRSRVSQKKVDQSEDRTPSPKDPFVNSHRYFSSVRFSVPKSTQHTTGEEEIRGAVQKIFLLDLGAVRNCFLDYVHEDRKEYQKCIEDNLAAAASAYKTSDESQQEESEAALKNAFSMYALYLLCQYKDERSKAHSLVAQELRELLPVARIRWDDCESFVEYLVNENWSHIREKVVSFCPDTAAQTLQDFSIEYALAMQETSKKWINEVKNPIAMDRYMSRPNR